MTKIVLNVLFVVFVGFSIAACDIANLAQQASPKPSAAAQPSYPTAAPQSANVASPSLGSIRFTPDAARKQSVDFAADGKDASLSVTDAAGYQWALTIPKDALIEPQTISITPFASIDSSGAALPIKSGVLLEPDGLQFSDAVMLTVTPPSPPSKHAAIVIAAQDGSNVEIAQSPKGLTYSAEVWHFSAGGWSDPSDAQWQQFLDQHLPGMRATYNLAKADVKALERPIEVPPTPPDYQIQCSDKENAAANQQVDAYMQGLFAKESNAITRMLSAARELALTGQDPGDEPLTLARELIETAMFRKVNMLFDRYSNDPQKFYAVAKVALAVMREDQLLGGQENSDWFQKITTWAYKVRDYYLDKLRKEHDYSVFPKVLLGIERETILLGGKDDSTQFLDEMAKAMTFKLTFDDKITVQRPAAPHAETRGEITILPSGGVFKMEGTATANYLSAAFATGDEVQLQQPKSFTATANLSNWDSCEKMTVDIIIDRFGADSETYFDVKHSSAKPVTVPGIPNGATSRAFPGGKFTASLQNQNAEAVNQTFTAQVGDANQTTVAVQLVLLHTPK